MNKLEIARRFLAAVVPWPGEGLTGYVNIHGRIKNSKDGKSLWFGRACQTLNEAVNTAEWMLRQKQIDIYFCTSLQSQFEERVSKSGTTYKAAVRRLEHVVALRSFYLDVDFGGEGHKETNRYATYEEAVRGLADFIKLSGFPKPTFVIKTGGGVHVYWTISNPLTVNEWKKYASALVGAGKKAGLKADYNATVDAVRLLRLPQTLNHKLDEARPVELAFEGVTYFNDRILKCLEPFVDSVQINNVEFLTPEIAKSASIIMSRYNGVALTDVDALIVGIDSDAGLKNLDEIAKGCAFIAEAINTGGRDFSQPLWNLTALIATFTEGGRADAHRMANGHPGYSVETTDALFDRKDKERSMRDLGWPSCRAIEAAGCTHCASCVYFGKIKSPLSIQVDLPAQKTTQLLTKVTPDDLPDGYIRREDGFVCELYTDENGNQMYEVIGLYSMEDPIIVEEPPPDKNVLYFFARVKGRKIKIRLPFSVINTANVMRQVVQSQGFMVPSKVPQAAALGRFLVSWIKHLQEIRETIVPEPIGWNSKNGALSGFSYAGKEFSPFGEKEVYIRDTDFLNLFKPTGSKKPWYNAWKLIAGRPDMEVIVSTAFASPLLPLIGHSGMTLSVYSDSGAGKSTAMEIAIAVWGQPKGGKFKTDDTDNSVRNKMGQLNNLPAYWDEVKTYEQYKKFLNLVFNMTLGSDKGRSYRDGSAKGQLQWNTILTMCSNESLMDYIVDHSHMTEASLFRIFEYEAEKLQPGNPKIVSLTKATQAVAALNMNYGHVGYEYAKFIGSNYGLVRRYVTKLSISLERVLEPDQNERFWVHFLACCLAGATIAKKKGLVPFDLKAMREFLLQKYREQQTNRKEAEADIKNKDVIGDLFSQFLEAHKARNTLWTDDMMVGPGKPPEFKVTRDTSKLEAVKVQIAEKRKTIRVTAAAIKDWCKSTKKAPTYAFLKQVEARFGAVKIRAPLGLGTRYQTGRQLVFDIDVTKHPQLNIFDIPQTGDGQ